MVLWLIFCTSPLREQLARVSAGVTAKCSSLIQPCYAEGLTIRHHSCKKIRQLAAEYKEFKSK